MDPWDGFPRTWQGWLGALTLGAAWWWLASALDWSYGERRVALLALVVAGWLLVAGIQGLALRGLRR